MILIPLDMNSTSYLAGNCGVIVATTGKEFAFDQEIVPDESIISVVFQ
jgi:hypothetical protein